MKYGVVDLGGSGFRSAVFSSGALGPTKRVALPRGSAPSPSLSTLCMTLKELSHGERLFGVGMSFAGTVDEGGVIFRWPNREEWEGFPLRAFVESELSCALTIVPDTVAHARGSARVLGLTSSLLVFLGCGTGVGAAVLEAGRAWSGARGLAGEVGHWIVAPSGPLCSCGSHGCLQALASGRALERMAEELGLDEPAKLFEPGAADGGARLIAHEIAQHLARALYNLHRLVDPHDIVLGGGVPERQPRLGTLVFDEVRRLCATARVPAPRLHIEPSPSDHTALLGLIDEDV